MTNFEHYKEDIENLSCLGNLALVGNKITECNATYCSLCKFNGKDCSQKAIKWLYSEYKEPPTLNEVEYHLCKALGTGWVARDKIGTLCVFMREPFKDYSAAIWGVSCGPLLNLNLMDVFNPLIKFDFITWNDKYPWKIEDLLKLEVKNT